jgi:hypothetical protein
MRQGSGAVPISTPPPPAYVLALLTLAGVGAGVRQLGAGAGVAGRRAGLGGVGVARDGAARRAGGLQAQLLGVLPRGAHEAAGGRGAGPNEGAAVAVGAHCGRMGARAGGGEQVRAAGTEIPKKAGAWAGQERGVAQGRLLGTGQRGTTQASELSSAPKQWASGWSCGFGAATRAAQAGKQGQLLTHGQLALLGQEVRGVTGGGQLDGALGSFGGGGRLPAQDPPPGVEARLARELQALVEGGHGRDVAKQKLVGQGPWWGPGSAGRGRDGRERAGRHGRMRWEWRGGGGTAEGRGAPIACPRAGGGCPYTASAPSSDLADLAALAISALGTCAARGGGRAHSGG